MTAARAQRRVSAHPLLATVQIARKELALDDVVYREILERLTGKRSAAGLNDRQLGRVLDEFKAKGWTPKVVVNRGVAQPAAKSPRRATHPVARKARALWISLHQLGVVENPSEEALNAFCKRQLGVDRLEWANQRHAAPLIEGLKRMAERAGWSQEGSLDEIKAALAVLLEARRQ